MFPFTRFVVAFQNLIRSINSEDGLTKWRHIEPRLLPELAIRHEATARPGNTTWGCCQTWQYDMRLLPDLAIRHEAAARPGNMTLLVAESWESKGRCCVRWLVWSWGTASCWVPWLGREPCLLPERWAEQPRHSRACEQPELWAAERGEAQFLLDNYRNWVFN